MALDVQPLSRGRWALMLLVLLALLAGSLAFAQWLTLRARREHAAAPKTPRMELFQPNEND